MTRSIFFKFRLSEKEKQAIGAKAARADLSSSDFIRREVGLKVLRPPPARPTKLLEHFKQAEENPGATALKRLGVKG